MQTHDLEFYIQGAFWLISLIALVPTISLISSSARIKSPPSDFDLMLRRSFAHKGEVTLRYSDFVEIMKAKFGKTNIEYKEDGKNYYVDAGSLIAGNVRDLLEREMAITIVVDSENIDAIVKQKLFRDELIHEDKAKENLRFYSSKFIIEKIDIAKFSFVYSLSDVIVREIHVKASSGHIHLVNCWVGSIKIFKGENGRSPDITFTNCMVGSAYFEPDSVSKLSINSTLICNLSCQGSEAKPPFFQASLSRDSQLISPRIGEKGEYFGFYPEDMQSLRNFRSHLEFRGEVQSVDIVRANELRIDRIKQEKFIKTVSFCYDALSGFGAHPQRSLSYVLFIFLYNIAMVYSNQWDLAIINCSNSTVMMSWQGQLCGDSHKSHVIRSIFLCLQTIVNPFGVIGGDPPVRASNIYLHLWLGISSLVSISAFAVTFLGIRRKFRLEK